jgi:hypothetical protein
LVTVEAEGVVMTTPDDPRQRDLYIVARTALDHCGMRGYDLACGIDPDGDRLIFLCCRPLLGLAPVLPAVDVEHERDTGPLPPHIAQRIAE